MKTTAISAFLALSASLSAATLDVKTSADTYLRNDDISTSSKTNWNDDPDNEIIVGSNAGQIDNIRSLLKFDVSPIIQEVNAVGGGNFDNLTIHSAFLYLYERRGLEKTIKLTVSDYAYAFDATSATWDNPAPGDTTPGCKIGTLLANKSLKWDATEDNEQARITLFSIPFRQTIRNHINQSVNLLLTCTSKNDNFLSFRSDRNNPGNRASRLVIDYSVKPQSGGAVPPPVANPAVTPVKPVETQLVCHWKLDESSGTEVQDSSGNNEIGALNGGAFWSPADGKDRGAVRFDENQGYISNFNSKMSKGPFTVALWVKPKSITQNGFAGIFANNKNNDVDTFQIDLGDGYNYRGTYQAKFGEAPLNKWVHLAVACDGTNTELYYNGIMTQNLKGAADMDFKAIIVGSNRIRRKFLNGMVDDVRIYRGKLKPEEVLKIYQSAPTK